jgi:endonuclease/exonuclease/phosphatase family metal-dependent hydrolase
VGKFKLLANGTEFLFMVNHFNRREEERRNQQADFVRNWSNQQNLPTIIVGDFNFDFDLNERRGNTAFNKLNQDNILKWIQPDCLASNNCLSTQCNPNFNSILDAVFVGGTAKNWSASSSIVPFDCSKDATGFPDHRIVKAELKVS